MAHKFMTFAGVFAVAAVTQMASAQEVTPPDSKPFIEPWGYPLEALDRDTKPGNDFFRFANGTWLDTTEIPVDRSGYGFSIVMGERNEERIAIIIDDLSEAKVKRGTDAQRIRGLYRSFLDVERIEEIGLKPFEDDLAEIRDVKTHEDVARLMADPILALDGPFGSFVWINSTKPDEYITWVGHEGLGLPDKSYFERDDARLANVRDAYLSHIGAMLALLGVEAAEHKAQAVFDLEKSIAALHWSRADRRDANRTYNPMDISALEDFAPGFPWRPYFDGAGLGDIETVVVQEKEAFPGLADLFATTPLDVWRDYLTFHYLSANARYMPRAFDDESFAFYGKTLSGQQQQRERNKRGIDIVNSLLDQAVGKIYIERFFPEESKRQMAELFENVRSALKTRIQNLSWMTPATKKDALAKLEKMTAKIAYPEKWREYDNVRIKSKDLFGNVKRIRAADANLDIERLSQPVDRAEWFTGPQTVNAFYSPTRNEAFIPAGYIQSPLFDPNADPALNYGAIGSIVGHEIGHGFDDQGSKYDGEGVLRDWWTEEDRAAFDALGDRLAEQFNQYEPLPGIKVNGRQTLGENIGDLAGVIITYHAYLLSLDGEAPPVLDGFTGQQRVFLGRAQARRYKRTEESLRRRLLSAPHSPMSLRVNGMVRNIDEWYEAFDVKPGDEMYLPPEERVRIW